MSTTIPEGLSELLEGFAISVLREKPTDLVQFAAEYFTKLHEQRGQPKEPARSVRIAGEPVNMESEDSVVAVKEVEMANEGRGEGSALCISSCMIMRVESIERMLV